MNAAVPEYSTADVGGFIATVDVLGQSFKVNKVSFYI